MTPAQKAAVAAILNTDLSTLDSDRLIELCVIYRAAPDALDTFPAALKTELERRYSSEVIASEDVNFGVLQHMANQFQSAIPYFHLRLLEMAGTVNRDIWFADHEAIFRSSIDNAEVAAWLIKQPDILNKCLGNRLALGYLAQSTTAATAILSDEIASAVWKDAPDLWKVWPRHSAGMQVLAKSAELVQYIIDTAPALSAVIAAPIAMQALAASPTAMRIMVDIDKAMTAVAASSVAMQAVAASSVAMQAVAASSVAMQAVAASEEKFKAAMIQHNEQLQAVRATMYDTVKAHWTQVRNIQLRDGQSGVRYENGSSALTAPANAWVFVCLGSYSNGHPNGRHRLEHPDGSTAADGGYRDAPTTMLAVDGVSFAGAKIKQTVNYGGSYAEVWAPKQ
nr:MAG TPA: Tail fiber protein [Caudoviricetes sp.]